MAEGEGLALRAAKIGIKVKRTWTQNLTDRSVGRSSTSF